MQVTLTFDNGPRPDWTPVVLDELGGHEVEAVFFVVGEALERPGGSELAQRAQSEGHRLGNHTFSHPRPLGSLPGPEAVAEITRTDAVLASLGCTDAPIRPSAGGGVLGRGLLNRAVVDFVETSNRSLVLWQHVCEDWRRPDGSWVDIALGQLDEHAWNVVVLHDVSEAMAHLPRFLDELHLREVNFSTSFPPELVPIRGGRVTGAIDHLLP